MNTSTLRGIFPDPKPIHRKNFVRENIKHLKQMQGLLQQESNATPHSSTSKSNKFRHVAPKVYSNITKRQSEGNVRRPISHNPQTKKLKPAVHPIYSRQSEIEQKIIDRGVQTERPEDVQKLYETGVLKYPTASVVAKVPTGTKPPSKIRGSGEGDNQTEKSTTVNGPSEKLTKNFNKLDLEDKPNHIKQNIKNIKTKPKPEETPDPTQPPPGYQKGSLPKYLKEEKKTECEYQPVGGLVLLPEDERKEYLRVARENYAALIKELNSMPVSNDTLKKRKRKMEIEDELKRLEEVIKIFQKPKVFVKADA